MASATPAPARTLQCVVGTPERAVLDEPVDFVALPMFDGEVGILPGRAALIGRLGYGELRTKRGNHVERFFVDGGFAQVRADVVTVLTPRALKASVPGATALPRTGSSSGYVVFFGLSCIAGGALLAIRRRRSWSR